MPKLSLDRPFTYLLPGEADAGTGSLVSVPFHGRTVKAWVIGPAAEVPPGRLLTVRKVRSSVRFFDAGMLELLRWVSERYIAPLSTVIERSHPPRVASEEASLVPGLVLGDMSARRRVGGGGPAERALEAGGSPAVNRRGSRELDKYSVADRLLEPATATWLRPLPQDEADVCVAAVGACLATGRRAIVLVPEAEPLPVTARAVVDEFDGRAVLFAGGDDRERYRTWLEIQAGRCDVVVGTRPAVFAPMAGLGLLWVSREVHPGHREERSPYFHVRDVAMTRARLHGAACVLASLVPSVETVAAADAGAVRVARPPRSAERRSAPLVETTAPEAEDRSPRLGALLKRIRSGALIVSRRGYGTARVCRSCGEPASCAACGGPIVVQAGHPRCRVCGRLGECAACGNRTFGVERGGTERIVEWASRIASVPVVLSRGGEGPPRANAARQSGGPRPEAPGSDHVVVGTAASVKDFGPLALDLVAILDPDRALARPGLHAGERALATWMEAAAWAATREAGGRVLVQTRRPGHQALQALIRWEPSIFLRGEADRRTEAGFPPGHPVFRITGTRDLDDEVRRAGATTSLPTTSGRSTVCLVTVPPTALPEFRRAIVRLAAEGVVTRIEAEPQL